ncbi:MAG: ATP-dependent zinc metalloprotease FtsH [Deltaproteobacteria bacterium]|nr:ATP-dependent zinc metalloprotease FtsH [Deltaproteobacteria bacterium]
MFYLIWTIVSSSRTDVQEVTFAEFLESVSAGDLKSSEVEIKNEVEFHWMDGKTKKKATGKLTDSVLDKLQSQKVKFKMVSEDNSALWQILVTWLPMLLVFFFLIFLMRQLQSGGGKAMSFGKAKARLVNEGNPKVTFKDVAGIDEAKEELKEIIDFLKDPKKFTRLGGRIPKGVLLMGPPGTGKTLLARAIAGEAGVPFFSISGSDFVEMFVGVGASRVRDLFEQSKKHAPCIVFIDEIDAVGRHRGAGLGGGHDEREQTLNQLLVEMDGFESNEGVILIAATNRPDVLDPALLRPGRFDRRVVVPRPDIGGRGEILKVHTKKVPLDEDVDLEVLARGTPGFSGADLSNLVNEAALIAAREDKSKVAHTHFEHAKDKVLMGTERKSMIISAQEKLITAYHEAGHTLVAKLIKNADPVHKVTIIPRGRALGLTQQLPIEDRYNMSRVYAQDRIAILFGGRVAEELQFGDMTTGAGNDLENATDLARKMVCEWGMSDKLGPLTFGKKEEAIFLGREIAQHQEYSEATAVEIDAEVKRIVGEQYRRAKDLVATHQDKLKAVADALIEYETLDGEEIEGLMQGRALTRPPPKIKMFTREEIDAKRKAEAAATDKKPRGVLGPLAGEVKA